MATAIVSPRKLSLTFPATGGSQTIQVDYDNATTIYPPDSFRIDDWFTVTKTSQGTESDGTVQHMYRVTMNPSVSPRTTTLEFSAVGSDGYKTTKGITIYQEAPTYSGEKSDIYVYNPPALFPHTKTTSGNITIAVGGSASKDGKKVLFWQNLTTSQSWITDFAYEESGSDDGETYYYYFSVALDANPSVNQRVGYCYADYICEDGEFGTATIQIRQEPYNGILFDGSNPLIWTAGNLSEASPKVTYTGVTNSDTIAQPPTISSGWNIVATYGTNLGSSYEIEYDINPTTYNVSDKDKVGTAFFQYTDKRSVHCGRTLYLNQKGTPYPFDIRYSDGSIITTEGIGVNKVKRIRKIPFSGGTLTLRCYFPFNKTISYSKLDGSYDWVRLNTNTGQIVTNTLGQTYTLTFAESKVTDVRSCKLQVEYESADGVKHYDEVQLFQDASDGSNLPPEITVDKTEYKVGADGTPDLSSENVYKARYVNLYPAQPTTTASWIHIGTPKILEGEMNSSNILWGFPVTYDENTSESARTATVTFSDSNGAYSKTINITQARFNKDIIITPDVPVEGGEYIGQIWKDVEYNFGTIDVVDYCIYRVKKVSIGVSTVERETLIYQGRSCIKPNETSNKILVNKICQDYLSTPELVKDTVAVIGGYEVFRLKTLYSEETLKTYKFVNDWSYTTDFKTGVLSHPILNDNTVYPKQYLPFTVFGAAEKVAVSYEIRYQYGATDDYGEPLRDWYGTKSLTNGVETEIFPVKSRMYGAEEYVIGDKHYPVVNDCKVNYVLYYVNPWGGYDWFPIKGKVVERDSVNQYTYTQNYNNTQWDFGKRRYLSEIHKKYTLNTHWLKEEESKRMWYLLESNVVYLHNLKTDEINPVIITANEVEYKQRTKTSSRISYQIEVELSQTRERL